MKTLAGPNQATYEDACKEVFTTNIPIMIFQIRADSTH